MKKLVVMPLILSAAFLFTACSDENQEEANGVKINSQAAAKLDKLIKEKASAATDAATGMVEDAVEATTDAAKNAAEATTDAAKNAAEATIDAGAAAVQEATGAADDVIDAGADAAKGAVDKITK